MDKRDLKADLTRLDQIKKMNSPVKLAKFKEFFGEEWLNQALAEKERADKYEALVRELVYSLKLIRCSSQFSHTTWEEITDLANIALIDAEEVLGG